MLAIIRVIAAILMLLSTHVCFGKHDPPNYISGHDRYVFYDSLMRSITPNNTNDILNVFARLERQARHYNDKETIYFCKLLRIELKNQHYVNGTVTDEYISVLNEIKKDGYQLLLSFMYSRLDDLLWVYREYIPSLHYALLSYDIYKHHSLEEFPLRLRFQHQLAVKYYAFNDYAKAKSYLLDLGNADTGSIGDILTSYYYNTLGLCYEKLHQHDSALTIFYSIYNEGMGINDYLVSAIASGNIGFTYYLLDQHDSALLWMDRERTLGETYSPGQLNANIAISAVTVADIYFQRGQVKEAEEQMEITKAFFVDDMYMTIMKNRVKKRYFLLKSRIHKHKNEMPIAFNYLDSARIISDSINKLYNKKNLLEAEYKTEQVKYELAIFKVEQERKASIYIRNTVIGIISLLFIILLLLINRRRILLEQKRVLLQKEKEKTTIELETATKQLRSFTKAMHEKSLLVDQVRLEITTEQNMDNENTNAEVLTKLRQLTILTDDEWSEFKELFEQVYGNFIYDLKKVEELTASEVRFMTLRKLKFSNKEMANILGVSESGIRNYKYRLRKKYGDEVVQKLDTLIKES